MRPGPTIAPSHSSLAYSPPTCRAHRWGGRPPFLLWSPAVSWCTPLWGGSPRPPLPPLTRGTTTLRLPRILLSAPWSVALNGGGTSPGPWVSSLSPPSSFCHTITPTVPPPYTSLPGTELLFPYFPAPLLSSPTASNISAGFDRPPPNWCYCRWSSVLGI